MRIAKSRLVNLFVQLGCPKAEKWSNEVLEGRIGNIYELFDLTTPVNEKYRKLFEKVYTAAKSKESILIVDDDEDPIDEPILRVDTSLRMSPYETPVEQMERQRGQKRTPKQEAADHPVEVEAAAEVTSPATRTRKRQDYSQYLSEWGTWKWMPGYDIDEFFLAGGSGTVEEIAKATKRKRVSVQRHLLLLHRFGLIIWGDGDIFRKATREERIDFIDNGIQEKFRPMSPFVVRKPFTYTETGFEQEANAEQDDTSEQDSIDEEDSDAI